MNSKDIEGLSLHGLITKPFRKNLIFFFYSEFSIERKKKKSLAMFLRFAVANDPSSRKRVERKEQKQPMQLEVVHTTCYS